MQNKIITMDQDRCISCRACEVHCKLKNKAPLGVRLGQLTTVGPVRMGGGPKIMSMWMPCYHCKTPWCMAACPAGAMRKRKDGLVYVKQDRCVGCKACILACPWSVPQYNESTGTVMKCDYCMDRLDRGLEPACVAACTAHALSFIDPNEASRLARKKISEKHLLAGNS